MRKMINKLVTALTLTVISAMAAVPCFAAEIIEAGTADAINPATGVQLGDMLPMIICGVVLLIAVGVGVVCAVMKKKKAEEEAEGKSDSDSKSE